MTFAADAESGTTAVTLWRDGKEVGTFTASATLTRTFASSSLVVGGGAAFTGNIDEKTDTPALCVVERSAATPFTVRLRATNAGPVPVKGAFLAWVNDDWELTGAPLPAELALATNETRILSFAVRAKPGRALNALYPIHASWSLPGGDPLHPIAIFRAKTRRRASRRQRRLPSLKGAVCGWTSFRRPSGRR